MCRVTHLIVFCHSLNFILSSKSFGHWTSKPPKSDGTERQKAPYLNIDKECFNIYKVELREQVKHLEEVILPSIEGNDKYDRVKAVQRELWVLNGILEYGFKEEILNKIS